jgi:hypothetical protein
LTFTNTASNAAGYTLSAGSAGSLTLDNTGSIAEIVVNGGSHGISAPLYLTNGTLEVTAGSSSVLTISGSLSDFGAGASLTLDGDGTGQLVLSGTNTLGGPAAAANVSSGTLVLMTNQAVADGTSLTVGDASAFSTVFPANSTETSASTLAISPVPEPGTIALLGLGLCSAAICRRRLSSRGKQPSGNSC